MITLNGYIDDYKKKTKNPKNKKIARHLKRIIPQTTHLDKDTYNEIVEELKKEMNTAKDFEEAFANVRKKYLLSGDVITSELPAALTRIILNKNGFISNILNLYNNPSQSKELKMVFASGDEDRIIHTLSRLRKTRLSRGKVAFATFDEKDKDKDPFLQHNVKEIIDMLALDTDAFDDDEPYTAVKLRYKNDEGFEKKYPVFVDAGWRDTFFPAGKDDNYGRTRKRSDESPCMPEVVHKNKKLSEVTVESFGFLEDQ